MRCGIFSLRWILKHARGFKPVYVIPHEKERENVEEFVGDGTSIVFITTPGQVCVFTDVYLLIKVEKL